PWFGVARGGDAGIAAWRAGVGRRCRAVAGFGLVGRGRGGVGGLRGPRWIVRVGFRGPRGPRWIVRVGLRGPRGLRWIDRTARAGAGGGARMRRAGGAIVIPERLVGQASGYRTERTHDGKRRVTRSV